MDIRTSRRALDIAETSFKPLEAGYLFETPNPWTWRPGRRYIVSEQQKSALLAILLSRQQSVYIALIGGGLLATAWIGILVWAISAGHAPDRLELIGMALALVAPAYALGVASRRRYLRRIEPIVSAAVPTRASFTAGERYRASGSRLPTWFLVPGATIWSLSAVVNVIDLLASHGAQLPLSDPHVYLAIFNLVGSSALAVFAVYTLSRRWRRNVPQRRR
jgi:hypothetical protein